MGTVDDGVAVATSKVKEMKPYMPMILLAMLAVLTTVISGCSTPAPQQVAELRDYPGQSYYCYLHKRDAGC